jgi:hypothetical protein
MPSPETHAGDDHDLQQGLDEDRLPPVTQQAAGGKGGRLFTGEEPHGHRELLMRIGVGRKRRVVVP